MIKKTVILYGVGGVQGTPACKETDVAITIMARDYKGVNRFGFNGVIEMEVRRIGGMYDGEIPKQAGSVYDKEGCSPTLTDMQGGNRQPMVVEEGRIKVLGNYMKSNHDASRVVDTEGIAPTVKENHGTVTGIVDTVRIKQATKEGYIECKVGGVADLSFPNSATRRGRVQDMGDTCPTIVSGENGLHRIESMYRIRKLTPKECWRLMDFSDEDFHKAEQVNSNTQLYKQAGNSIVKNCLVAIFGQMIPGKENVYKERFDERKI